MPSHLSEYPKVEANKEELCPRNLIRGLQMDNGGQTLFPMEVVLSNGCFQATNPQTRESG